MHPWQEVDISAGETRTPGLLTMNPNGKIPQLALPNGRYLPESNAIISYLPDGTEFTGSDAFERATPAATLNSPFVAGSKSPT